MLIKFFIGQNNLFKDINERRELPLDIVVLSCYQLSIYYCNEIKRGFGNTGNYKLKFEYKENYFIDSAYVELRETTAPSDIIKSLVGNKLELFKLAGVEFITIDSSSSHNSTDNDKASA